LDAFAGDVAEVATQYEHQAAQESAEDDLDSLVSKGKVIRGMADESKKFSATSDLR